MIRTGKMMMEEFKKLSAKEAAGGQWFDLSGIFFRTLPHGQPLFNPLFVGSAHFLTINDMMEEGIWDSVQRTRSNFGKDKRWARFDRAIT